MGGRFALPVGNGLPDFLGLGRVVKFLVMLGEDMQKSPFTRHHIGSSASTKSSRMVLVMLSIKDWWLR